MLQKILKNQTNMLKKNILTGLIYFIFVMLAQSQTNKAHYEVIPLPNKIVYPAGKGFVLDKDAVIEYPVTNKILQSNATFLADYIEEVIGQALKIQSRPKKKNYIRLELDGNIENQEGYVIEIDQKGIVIKGLTEAGIFYGIQTLRKSLPVNPVEQVFMPAVVITDFPRFPYRGMMLDVARHFTRLDNVKTYVDILALHNVNHLHLHLTDDQGWRIEIKKYPLLTEIGSKRAETVIGKNTGEYDGIPHKGYFTQEEMKELITYAKARFITIIPEIDLPGHMLAALAGYPELGCTGGPYEVWTKWGVSDDVLCAGNEKILTFIEDILTEVAALFPAEYVHIGGDECHKTRWKACEKCQAKIKSLGLVTDEYFTAEERLQSYVIAHAEKVLNNHGKKMIGWEEILQGGVSKSATIMSWRARGTEIKAAKSGNHVIMTTKTSLYFDYYQAKDKENEPFAIGGYVPVQKVYEFNPVPEELTEEEGKSIIGVQANVWTEYMPNFSHVQYMILPRLAALCEVQWMQQEKRNHENFTERIPMMMDIYRKNGYNFREQLE
jgi:hexosaminidase